jgi:sn-glycerol 3-phosphate transport system substrate-binding protein
MRKSVVFSVLVLAMIMSLSFATVTVTFWHAMGGAKMDFLKSMADQFMKTHPDIKVVVQYTGSYRDTLNKLIAAAGSSSAPDIVQVFDVGTQIMVDGGIEVPMQDLIDSDPTFDVGTLLPQVLSYYRINGKLYSMPFNSSNAIMYYNKTMFKKAGLDPDNPPRTYSQFIAACKALTKKDANGNIITSGFTTPLHSWIFEQMMAAQDALMCDNNNGRTGRPTKTVFDSQAGLNVFQLWNTLSQNDWMINTKKEDWDGADALFVAQKVGMLITSTSDVSYMMKMAKEKGFELGTAFLPVPDGSKPGGAVIGGASLWIIKGHPKAETQAAWEFVKFMASKPEQMAWHKMTGYFPISKDAVTTMLMNGWYKQNPDHLTALMQLLLSKQDYASRGAIIGAYPQIRTAIETAIENMIQGKWTPGYALNWANKQGTIAIQNYNSSY